MIFWLQNQHTIWRVTDMCSIAYEPCDENSFKIGPPILSGKRGQPFLIAIGNQIIDIFFFFFVIAYRCWSRGIRWRRHGRRNPNGFHGFVQRMQWPRYDALRFRRIFNGKLRSLASRSFRFLMSAMVLNDFSRSVLQPQGGPGICDLLHCGNNFCSDNDTPCRIESMLFYTIQ